MLAGRRVVAAEGRRMLAVIQARMTSTRFPGKVLVPLHGRPVLSHVLDHVAAADRIDDVVVATSIDASDDPIDAAVRAEGFVVVRGPLHDVAARFVEVLRVMRARAFVRVSADSPLIDPAVIDAVVEGFSAGGCDLSTNVFPRTFPVGQSVECVGSEAFHLMLAQAAGPRTREHVTSGFYEASDRWRIRNIESGTSGPFPSLAVDEESDLRLLTRVVDVVGPAPTGWRTLVDAARRVADQ